ncbi:MAG TPA: DUF1993 domain-containing protein [Xanthomonadales bacterium]|nr:DUF1993 domain-containing protein [Xanthomonadales bacterium]
MTISLYDTANDTFRKGLRALDAILTKAEAHATAKGYDPANLLRARLAPDMFDLVKQVQIACDMAKSGGARLAGVDVPSHPDTETTYAELHARIAKVNAFLDTLDRNAIDGAAGRDVVVPLRDRKLEFKGRDYLVGWVLPNLYFHLTTAYAILRHNGVELGKKDFLGGQ